MSWLDDLKARWLSGRNRTPAATPDDEREDRGLSSPDEEAQFSTLTESEREDVLDRTEPPPAV